MTRKTDRWLPPFAFMWLALAVAIAPASAFAQDEDAEEDDVLGDDDEDSEDEDDADDDEAEDDDEEADDTDDDDDDEEDTAAPAADAPIGREKIVTEETIYAIQKKARLIGSSFEITPQLLQSVNDRFVSQTGGMLSGLYHFRENLALEFNFGTFAWWDSPGEFLESQNADTAPHIGGHFTNTTTELQDRERLQPEYVKLNWMTWLATADFQWSPLQGKVSIHDFLLGTFSVYLSVGAGFAGLHNRLAPDLPGPFGAPVIGPVQLVSTVGGGLRFYFFDWLGIRFEVRDYVQPLALLVTQGDAIPNSTFEVRNTLMMQLGLSFLIPMPWGPR